MESNVAKAVVLTLSRWGCWASWKFSINTTEACWPHPYMRTNIWQSYPWKHFCICWKKRLTVGSSRPPWSAYVTMKLTGLAKEESHMLALELFRKITRDDVLMMITRDNKKWEILLKSSWKMASYHVEGLKLHGCCVYSFLVIFVLCEQTCSSHSALSPCLWRPWEFQTEKTLKPTQT